MENLRKWKDSSFQIEHWMEEHGLSTSCPKFKFTVIGCFNDPLRRQLFEALAIRKEGMLNRKQEFNQNEICRMEMTKMDWEVEKDCKELLETRLNLKKNLKMFINVMSSIAALPKHCDLEYYATDCADVDILSVCRDKMHGTKRGRGVMETSTPCSQVRRHQELIPDDSPIEEASMSSTAEDDDYVVTGEVTGMSPKMVSLAVTPPKTCSSTQEEKDLVGGAGNLSSAAKRGGIIARRSNSLPGRLRIDLKDNTFFLFNKYPRMEDDHSKAEMEIVTNNQEECLAPGRNKPKQKRSYSVGNISYLDPEKRFDWLEQRTDVNSEELNGRPEKGAEKPSSLFLGLNASPTLLSSPATPVGRGDKRQQERNSNSPDARPRKLSVGEGASPFLRKEFFLTRDRAYSTTAVAEGMDRRPAAESTTEENIRRPAGLDTTSSKPLVRRNTAPSRARKPRLAARFPQREVGQRLITTMLTPGRPTPTSSKSQEVKEHGGESKE